MEPKQAEGCLLAAAVAHTVYLAFSFEVLLEGASSVDCFLLTKLTMERRGRFIHIEGHGPKLAGNKTFLNADAIMGDLHSKCLRTHFCSCTKISAFSSSDSTQHAGGICRFRSGSVGFVARAVYRCLSRSALERVKCVYNFPSAAAKMA